MSTIMQHLREIAEESGIDLDAELANSRHDRLAIPGTDQIAETFYQEAATWMPHRAFLAGVGEGHGWSPEEAVLDLARKALPIIAAGNPVGIDYLASIGIPGLHVQRILYGMERLTPFDLTKLVEIPDHLTAQKLYSDGVRIYAFHDMAEEYPIPVTSLEMLHSYSADCLYAQGPCQRPTATL